LKVVELREEKRTEMAALHLKRELKVTKLGLKTSPDFRISISNRELKGTCCSSEP